MSQDKIPLNKKEMLAWLISGILAGLGTMALFYFLMQELQRVFP